MQPADRIEKTRFRSFFEANDKIIYQNDIEVEKSSLPFARDNSGVSYLKALLQCAGLSEQKRHFFVGPLSRKNTNKTRLIVLI